jgi:hypothetical protein
MITYCYRRLTLVVMDITVSSMDSATKYALARALPREGARSADAALVVASRTQFPCAFGQTICTSNLIKNLFLPQRNEEPLSKPPAGAGSVQCFVFSLAQEFSTFPCFQFK